MKALEYKEYFTHINSEQILKSLEDIHVIGLIKMMNEKQICARLRVQAGPAMLPMMNTDETWK
jgi:hypothetical protein